ncbi:unnamed protein product [Lampetra fluviatilis]
MAGTAAVVVGTRPSILFTSRLANPSLKSEFVSLLVQLLLQSQRRRRCPFSLLECSDRCTTSPVDPGKGLVVFTSRRCLRPPQKPREGLVDPIEPALLD